MPHVRWDRPAPEPCCHCFPLVLIVCTVASPGNPSGRHWLPDCESTAVDSRHAVPKESRRVRIVKGSRAGTCGECPELDAFESRGWRHVFLSAFVFAVVRSWKNLSHIPQTYQKVLLRHGSQKLNPCGSRVVGRDREGTVAGARAVTLRAAGCRQRDCT